MDEKPGLDQNSCISWVFDQRKRLITGREAAKAIGCSLRSYWNYESGERQLSYAQFVSLTKVLGYRVLIVPVDLPL